MLKIVQIDAVSPTGHTVQVLGGELHIDRHVPMSNFVDIRDAASPEREAGRPLIVATIPTSWALLVTRA